MIREGSAFFKPGTVFLFVLIALLGFGLYNWADASIGDTREKSLESQENAIACSSLEISSSGVQTNQNQTTVFFKTNMDLERLNLNFEGETNVTKSVELVEEGMIESATANISDFSSVALKAPNCERVFRFE